MKTQLTLTAMGLVLALSNSALAGVGDFHSMIEESQQAKKELTQKLQKNVDIVKDSSQTESSKSHEKIVFQDEDTESENIVAPSSGFRQKSHSNRKASAKLEQNSMNRVSQEFQDAQ